MEYQFSAFDIHFMLKELRKTFLDGKINKIYQSSKREFLFDMHIAGKGRMLFKISLPGVFHKTEVKFEMPTQPPHFCVVLRKYLHNAFLREINQIGFERIVDFVFDTKEGTKHLVVEMFSKGNMFLTDQDYIIKYLLENQNWKSRTLRGNVKYEHPQRDLNPLIIDFDNFSDALEKSDKESVVKTLAIDFGMGGRYATEVCIRANIDKDKYLIEENEKTRVYDELQKLKDEDLQPIVYYEGVQPKIISPINLFSIDYEQKSFPSFNEALDKILTETSIEDQKQRQLAPYEKKVNALKQQIKQQQEQIEKQEKEAEELQKKGEMIYNNYTILDPVLNELKDIIRKHSQKDIKEKLKGHNLIKEINFKEKTVLVELED